jgi:hypothetical protein
LLTGRLSFVLWLLLPPLLLAAAHAALRGPARRPGDAQRLANELRSALKAELRGDTAADDIDVEEVEGGGGGGGDTYVESSPLRDDAMAQRVNAIRAKYRPAAFKAD